MKALFDTSVLVAAMVASHPAHTRAQPWLRRAKERELEFTVAAHTLAETYAVLTSLPTRPRLGPAAARRLLRENVEAHASIVALTAVEHSRTLDDMAGRGLSGGVVYDALIARAAAKAGADRLVTLNGRDFQRVWPDGVGRITVV